MGDNTRVDLGLRVGMLRGHPRMARGFGAPRGRRVVHRDSNPRMARGFGAPRGRRVGKAVEWPSNTTGEYSGGKMHRLVYIIGASFLPQKSINLPKYLWCILTSNCIITRNMGQVG